MNPDTRMAASLVLSLLLSAKNLKMAAAGEAEIVDVGLRYVGGFLLVFVLVGIVGRLVNAYIRAARAAEVEVEDDDGETFGALMPVEAQIVDEDLVTSDT